MDENDKAKLKQLQQNVPQCHLISHESHGDQPGIKTGPLQHKASDQPPEFWHDLLKDEDLTYLVLLQW